MPKPEIILFGDEEGTAQICQELGLRYAPEIARNEFGTPLLNDVFEQAQRLATYDLLCYVNADIILMSDIIRAIEQIRLCKKTFVLAGAKRNINLNELWNFSQEDWEQKLIALAEKRYSKFGVDYFIFTRGCFKDVPPLAVGRWAWDGWLLWKTRTEYGLLIDVTPVVFAIHQNHDYSLIQTDGEPPWLAKEALRNIEIGGRCGGYCFIYEATHCLTPKGLKRLWFQRSLYKLNYLLIYRFGKIRQKLGLRRVKLNKIKYVISSLISNNVARNRSQKDNFS